jgi:hypothetical protein
LSTDVYRSSPACGSLSWSVLVEYRVGIVEYRRGPVMYGVRSKEARRVLVTHRVGSKESPRGPVTYRVGSKGSRRVPVP